MAFNNILRKLMNLKRDQSISAYLVHLDMDNFNVLQRKSIFRFKSTIEASDSNVLVRTIAHSVYFQSSSLHALWCKKLYLFDYHM